MFEANYNYLHPLATRGISVAFENALLRVEHNEVCNSTTQENSYALRIAPAALSVCVTVVIPVLPDGRVLLVGRYRYATAAWSLEFPRVCRPSGELTWREIATENLRQDTGLVAEQMRLIGGMETDSAVTAIPTIVVWAQGCACAGPLPPNARSLIAGGVALDVEEFDHLIRRGEVTCGYTLAALCLYRAMQQAEDSADAKRR